MKIAALFVVSPSGSLALTETWFVVWPVAFVVILTTMGNVVAEPATIVPKLVTNTPPGTTPLGRVSVTVTFEAVPGPALLTAIR